MADYWPALCFVIAFYVLVSVLGTFTSLTFPYSWRMGLGTNQNSTPPFQLIQLISALMLMWAILRMIVYRRKNKSTIGLLIIPIVVPIMGIVYAQSLVNRSEMGREYFEIDLEILNERIEQTQGNPDWLDGDIKERDRLIRLLQE